MVKVATPPGSIVAVPRAVVELHAEVGQLRKETVPVGAAGSLAALAPVTVARSVTSCGEAGEADEATRPVDVASVNSALPV